MDTLQTDNVFTRKEYIEREALLADIEACVRITSRPDQPSAELRGANKVISRINVIPAADVAPVRHGRWKKFYADHEAFGVRPFFRYCSECHEATVHQYNYCPHCGARMDGDGE